jgi:hypothetical protein
VYVDTTHQNVIDIICLCTQDGDLVGPPSPCCRSRLIPSQIQTDDSKQDLSDKIDASGVVGGSLRSVVDSVGGPPGFKQKCVEAGESAVSIPAVLHNCTDIAAGQQQAPDL